MDYNEPFGSADPNASYVDRNTPGAVSGSRVPGAAIEHPQREIVHAITQSGQTPVASDLTQLGKAIAFGYAGNVDVPVAGWQSAPPASPAMGDRYVVAANPTGAWAGQSQKVATWLGQWSFATPVAGLIVNYSNAGALQPLWFDGTKWDFALVIMSPVTKTVFGANADFVDLNAADRWLAQYRISGAGRVTFQIPAGKHVVRATQSLSHPDGALVTLRGAALTGNGFPAASEFQVTGHTASARAADTTANLALLRARFPSELEFTEGLLSLGFVGTIENLLVTSNGALGDGVEIIGSVGTTMVTRLAGCRFPHRNIVTSLAKVRMVDVVGIGGTRGVSIEGNSTIELGGRLFGFSNSGEGVAAFSSSVATAAGGVVVGSGNGRRGIVSSLSASFHTSSTAGTLARLNGSAGFMAEAQGYLHVIASASRDNAESGYLAEKGGFIDAENTVATGNGLATYAAGDAGFIRSYGGSAGTTSPAVNTVGNANGYIAR